VRGNACGDGGRDGGPGRITRRTRALLMAPETHEAARDVQVTGGRQPRGRRVSRKAPLLSHQRIRLRGPHTIQSHWSSAVAHRAAVRE
jgi:hypothetical protein